MILKLSETNKTYDLKNAKKNKKMMKGTKRQITKSETKKLHNELIKIDIDAIERNKSNGVRKYINIVNNIGAIFTGAYLHYKDKPKETMFERVSQRD